MGDSVISEKEAREAAERRRAGGYATDDDAVDDETLLIEWSLQELSRRDWQDEPSGDGWYWCEELDADAPPQKIDQNGDGKFRRWTIAGWVDLNGRVCKITERPA